MPEAFPVCLLAPRFRAMVWRLFRVRAQAPAHLSTSTTRVLSTTSGLLINFVQLRRVPGHPSCDTTVVPILATSPPITPAISLTLHMRLLGYCIRLNNGSPGCRRYHSFRYPTWCPRCSASYGDVYTLNVQFGAGSWRPKPSAHHPMSF